MSAVPDIVAARRIQELEAIQAAYAKRNIELARQVDLLNSENDRLRDELSVLRSEHTTLRLSLAGVIPADE